MSLSSPFWALTFLEMVRNFDKQTESGEVKAPEWKRKGIHPKPLPDHSS
jgi:hypothetical protein